jgi:C1A family cysteine protease
MSRTRQINGQLRHLAGWLPDRPDHRDLKYVAPRRLLGSSRATKVDLRGRCSKVENQGALGACTASAATSALEFLYLNAGRSAPDLSRLFCYYATRVWVEHRDAAEDSGAMIRDVMKALASRGCCLEATWPYDPRQYAVVPSASAQAEAKDHQILWYYRIPNLDSLKLCVSEGFPVIGGFAMPASILSAATRKSGIVTYPGPTEKFVGGHAVLFCGFDDATKRLTFVNSWGEGWGDGGYGFLPYEFVTSWLANDFWTIRTAEP